ncbi:MotA/TolQ/ExbB proton channel family protein [Coleofasciculus sp. E1-EBD-02]|uniref:MotA/TolQ/ExbB proton channel family protein n=1 Tax=Coleofasciculus sp. E1-EBD-02 TaxID=3068481 RepID=UPI0032FD96C2
MEVNNVFSAGGVVMLPLLGFSVLAIALTIERAAFWFRVNRRQRRLVRDVLSLYRRDPIDAIKSLKANADLPIARVFLTALELEQPTPEEFRLALESEAQAEIPILKRFSVAFETIIGLSPMLGLLGTVLGLINSFASLRVGDIGASQSAGVTGGISEALVSTAAGLVVAMFTLMVSNIFRGFYLRQIALIQEYGGQLELLYRRRYEKQTQTKGEPEYAST